MLQSPRRVSPEKKRILMIILSIFILDKVGILFPGFWNTVGLISVCIVSLFLSAVVLGVIIAVSRDEEIASNFKIPITLTLGVLVLLKWFQSFYTQEYQISVIVGILCGIILIITALGIDSPRSKE